jgi:hypothetical protein
VSTLLVVSAALTVWAARPAAAQTGGCTATGNGTSWVIQEPGPGAPSAGIAVGAPGGANVTALSVTGWTGRLSMNGLPAGTTLEFFANSTYPAGQSFSVNVTTNVPVTSGAFTTYPINSTQSGYLPLVSCPLQISGTGPTTTTTTTPLKRIRLMPHYITSSSDGPEWLWWVLIGTGGTLTVIFFGIHTNRDGSLDWLCCDDDDDDEDDDGFCSWLSRVFCNDAKRPGLSAADEAAAATAMDDDLIPIAGDSAKPPDEVM